MKDGVFAFPSYFEMIFKRKREGSLVFSLHHSFLWPHSWFFHLPLPWLITTEFCIHWPYALLSHTALHQDDLHWDLGLPISLPSHTTISPSQLQPHYFRSLITQQSPYTCWCLHRQVSGHNEKLVNTRGLLKCEQWEPSFSFQSKEGVRNTGAR